MCLPNQDTSESERGGSEDNEAGTTDIKWDCPQDRASDPLQPRSEATPPIPTRIVATRTISGRYLIKEMRTSSARGLGEQVIKERVINTQVPAAWVVVTSWSSLPSSSWAATEAASEAPCDVGRRT